MWDRPQVHVVFQDYTISFTIKDINKALALLAETGDSTNGTDCGLDTNANYITEIYPGMRMDYRNKLQQLMHRELGAFLISAKHAYIVNHKRRQVPEVIMDIEPQDGDLDIVYIKFYDPRNNKLLFSGSMHSSMYNKDLGID